MHVNRIIPRSCSAELLESIEEDVRTAKYDRDPSVIVIPKRKDQKTDWLVGIDDSHSLRPTVCDHQCDIKKAAWDIVSSSVEREERQKDSQLGFTLPPHSSNI